MTYAARPAAISPAHACSPTTCSSARASAPSTTATWSGATPSGNPSFSPPASSTGAKVGSGSVILAGVTIGEERPRRRRVGRHPRRAAAGAVAYGVPARVREESPGDVRSTDSHRAHDWLIPLQPALAPVTRTDLAALARFEDDLTCLLALYPVGGDVEPRPAQPPPPADQGGRRRQRPPRPRRSRPVTAAPAALLWSRPSCSSSAAITMWTCATPPASGTGGSSPSTRQRPTARAVDPAPARRLGTRHRYHRATRREPGSRHPDPRHTIP